MNFPYDAVLVAGPQGAGKGTQSEILCQKIGFYHWDMGAIFRQVARGGSSQGREIERIINAGQLVTDELLYGIFQDHLAHHPEIQNILFDGFPRTLGNLEFLLNFLQERGQTNAVTIYLELPLEVCVARLLERAHHEFRKDDTRVGILERLLLFEKQTVPVLERLKQETTFVTIDAQPPIPQVTEAINLALGL